LLFPLLGVPCSPRLKSYAIRFLLIGLRPDASTTGIH